MKKALLLFAIGIFPIETTIAQDRPNVIVILADDLGFADLGCYGSEIPTPNLDALAKKGIRFTNFYNTARCCPSRAALLTGIYPHQAGVGHMMEDKGPEHPAYRGRLNNNTVTIGEVMKNAGYFTAMAGKWHVGLQQGVVPWKRGFDRSLCAPAGGFYYGDHPNAKLFYNGILLAKRSSLLPKDWYSTDLWSQYSLKFIDGALQEKKPFMLYLAYNAPHFPLQAPLDEIEKFKKKYMEGWKKLREQRYKKQLKLGLLDPSAKLTPFNPNVPDWDQLSQQDKEKFDHIMAIYAAVVSHMDKSIGDLVAGLKKRKVFDNTVILFVSDNGGNAEPGPEAKYDGAIPGSSQSSVFLGQGWAEACCTPFWGYKHQTHEGGISSPCIISWPAGIPASKNGTFERQPAHITDIMATLVDLGKTQYPSTFGGNSIPPLEGTSIVPAFTGGKIKRTNPIFWEHEGNKAILDGKWKLVAEHTEQWQLYDIENDRSELHDLSAEQPEITGRLKSEYESWYQKVQAEPFKRTFKWFYNYKDAKAAL
ncbi:sulfatase-like hydrolase/transferase [Chitinophaga sp. SYP-B3965]|uniref:arylsulfatase n=1 Tax=Chitinophaga sp. SYP-B3965 TaxID=2663120 RepID=UPI001299E696|nr:arylsulfatase [Chitinophaga sp. SYP-B3965]MRG44542.1 sulfatase-like hydrolase/transferase [Chitinophaga sp. SYP-B3965]